MAPDRPFSTEVELTEITEAQDLELVVSAEGQELLSYRPREPVKKDMPVPVEPPQSPQNIESIEELCLAGQRLEQFYNPSYDPLPYYKEALRRDPGDSRVNTALGIHFLKQGIYAAAEERFKTALARLARNYTRPQDCTAYYYLGVTLRAQEKLWKRRRPFSQPPGIPLGDRRPTMPWQRSVVFKGIWKRLGDIWKKSQLKPDTWPDMSRSKSCSCANKAASKRLLTWPQRPLAQILSISGF